MGETRLLDPELDLRDALGACARIGHARVPSALSADLLRRLRAEIEGGPFRPFGESFGPVRQQIDGYDIAVPGPGFPLLTALCRELREVVRSQGDGLRGWPPGLPTRSESLTTSRARSGSRHTWTASGTGGW